MSILLNNQSLENFLGWQNFNPTTINLIKWLDSKVKPKTVDTLYYKGAFTGVFDTFTAGTFWLALQLTIYPTVIIATNANSTIRFYDEQNVNTGQIGKGIAFWQSVIPEVQYMPQPMYFENVIFGKLLAPGGAYDHVIFNGFTITF